MSAKKGRKITYFYFWSAVTLAILAIFYSLRGVIAPFIAALVLAYFLNPLVSALTVGKRCPIPRSLAAILAILGIILMLSLFFLMVLPVLYAQIIEIIHVLQRYSASSSAEESWPRLHEFIRNLDPEIVKQFEIAAADYANHVLKFFGSVLGSLLYSSFTVVSVLALIVMTPILTFYMLRDWSALLAATMRLVPRSCVTDVKKIGRNLDRVLKGYLYGQTAVCLFLSLFYSTGLFLVGLNYSFSLGIMTGFFSLIPYVGMIFGAGLAVVVAILQFSSSTGVFMVLLVFICGNILEGNIVSPKLIGDRVELHPAWIIFGLLAGGYIGGFVGMLISFPLTAIIGVFIRFMLSEYQQTQFYQH